MRLCEYFKLTCSLEIHSLYTTIYNCLSKRHLSVIAESGYTITYIPRANNSVTDALSHIQPCIDSQVLSLEQNKNSETYILTWNGSIMNFPLTLFTVIIIHTTLKLIKAF